MASSAAGQTPVPNRVPDANCMGAKGIAAAEEQLECQYPHQLGNPLKPARLPPVNRAGEGLG
jgi:hypothetical protein